MTNNTDYKDPGTGLYDRTFFLSQLGPALDQIEKSRRWGALLMVELVNLEDVTEVHGDRVAEKLVIKFAEALRFSVRLSDTVARCSKGRFAILLRDGMQPTAAINLTKRQLSKLVEPFAIGEHRVAAEIAVGIRVIAPPVTGAERIVMDAEQALALAKERSGSQRYLVFQGEEDQDFCIESTQTDGRLRV